VGWWWVDSHLATTTEAIGAAELQTSLQNLWQAAKFVIDQSAKNTVLCNKLFSS